MAAAAEGSLPRPVIEAAVGAVAPAGQALRQLALALAADPGALARGAPPVAGKLAAELIARGSAALPVPACAVCGRTGKPLTRGNDGDGVCQRCRSWQRAVACASCGKIRPRAGTDAAGQGICEVCCRNHDPKRRRTCGRCGKTSPVAVRGRDGRPDICVNCYKLPAATCSICGSRKECNFAATARPVCIACSPRAAATCARCGQDRPPAARWPEGPVCDPCYTAALRHRGRCASCGQQRRLVTPPGPAADTCADCAGIPVTHACTGCGTEDKLYEKGRCARCSLRRRARELLSAGTGTIAAELTGVFDAVTAARQPRSALNWLRKGAGADLLADVAAGRLAISHDALDDCPRRRAADYLRHMLTAAGTLPPRDEELARTGQWLTGVLEAISPAADRRLVQAYATWQVMRRLRASAAGTARPRTPTAHARNNIRAAVTFLAWLRSRGTELTACGQADVDQWLHTGPSACLARDFLAWAAARGHCGRLTIPAPPRATGPALSQDQRWALAARLLHDTALEPTDRVAGCLLLLYGQPLSRIAAMTTSQVTRRDDQAFIRLGRHDAPVPAPLAGAVLTLISDGRSYRGVGSPPATAWLFPGHLPGRPITPARLGERLRALGIYAQTGRRAALLDLATQLPAAVLADLLGLHETTAAKWMHQAGGDWSRYAAQMARSRPHNT
jgi:integrase